MSSNYINNRNRRPYMELQTDALTLPASVSAATNYFLCSKLSLDQTRSVIKDTSILGQRFDLPGVPGRISGSWSLEIPMRGSSAAGSAPDHEPLLAAAFGQPGVAITTPFVGWEYLMNDNIPTFALYHYRVNQSGGTTGVTQQIGIGCGVTDITFTMGSDLGTISANGSCVGVADSDNWAVYTGPLAPLKGGLSGSFPTEPSTGRAYHGALTVGFTGSLILDSGASVDLKTLTIKYNTGNSLVDDSFSFYTGTGYQGDLKSVDISMTFDDSDSTVLQNLKQKALTFAPVSIVATAGTIAGSTYTFTLNNVQIASPKYSDGPKGRMHVDFSSSLAHPSSLGANDAFSLIIS